ncbi:MAG: putative Bug-like extracytoplasmic solute binding receptor, family [Betaproteobacteria bacterium]|nr:putative Bug-like extracytoplasmic solute binding receptor, family [Betaproteobacteria bacterium]
MRNTGRPGGKFLKYAAALCGALLTCAVHAQDYPNRPIRFIVGPSPDILARMLGEKITDDWKQPVVVDLRPAASGLVAADSVAKAPSDGYTILLGTATDPINETLFASVKPYNLVRDLAPVSYLATVPFFLVINGNVKANTLPELVQLAKANSGKLNYTTPGSGTPPHLAAELLNRAAGINLVHVPYKTVPDMMKDLLAGEVQVSFAVAPAALPHVKTGKLKALAVSSATRFAAAPEIPTVAETYPGFKVVGWYGLLTTAGTPKPVIDKLSAEVNHILKMPEIQARMRDLGMEPAGTTPEEHAATIKSEIATWSRVIKEFNIHAN